MYIKWYWIVTIQHWLFISKLSNFSHDVEKVTIIYVNSLQPKGGFGTLLENNIISSCLIFHNIWTSKFYYLVSFLWIIYKKKRKMAPLSCNCLHGLHFLGWLSLLWDMLHVKMNWKMSAEHLQNKFWCSILRLFPTTGPDCSPRTIGWINLT